MGEFVVRVHQADHKAVEAYYRERGTQVRCEHHPTERWIQTAFEPETSCDRYAEDD